MAESEALSYAVRLPMVRVYLGQLAMLLGGLSLPPAVFTAIDGERAHALAYALVAAILGAGGWLLQRRRPDGDIQINEALVVVAAIFILASFVLALPMMAAGVGFVDALFEAVSGITTTGLSTFATLEDKPRSLLFTAAWLQWLGGIGIMVLSFALLFGQSASAKRLTGVLAEQQGLAGGTRAYAILVIRIYAGLTLLGVVALFAAGAGWFPAITLTLAAVSTGGYAPYNASLGGLSGGIQNLTILLSVAGAIAMPLYHEVLRGNWRAATEDVELRTLLVAGIVVSALLAGRAFAANDGNAPALSDLIRTAFSAQTTAGFSTVAVGEFDTFSKVVLIFSMGVGGGVGSSAGGIKLLRIIVLIRLVQLTIQRTRLTPHAAVANNIAGRTWKNDELVQILAFVGLFTAVPLVSWLPFLWFGYDPLDALFEVVSATGTVGLSTGIAGPDLQPLLKGLLCIDMLLGRLEILPLLVLLAPRTWVGQRRRTATL